MQNVIWKARWRGPEAVMVALSDRLDESLELWTSAICVEKDRDGGAWRCDAYFEDAPDGPALDRLTAAAPGASSPEVIETPDEDWVAMSLKGLTTVEAGRFFLYGAHDADKVPVGALALHIEAGLAFGTGHHATTKGCLTAFDALAKARSFSNVLDVGCGSGVLAMAAALRFRRKVLAADIDPVSVEVTQQNARANGLSSFVDAVESNGFSAAEIRRRAPYDLIFANILARPLIALAPAAAAHMAPGGHIILSGLLIEQERAVRAAYAGAGFHLRRRLHIEDWSTLVMQNGEGHVSRF